MEFREIGVNEKSTWNGFILQNSPESFLQSFEWGEFQKATGRGIFHFAACEGDDILALALIIEHKLPLGLRYWYMPRGPVVVWGMEEKNKKEALDFFLGHVKAEAKKHKIIFVRMDPACEKNKSEFFTGDNIKSLSGSVQPKDTLVLDISKSEEELMAQMKQKTRYNIRLAEKKGVQVAALGFNKKDFQEFWRLIGETSQRDGIVSHDKKYYADMLKALGDEKGDLKARLYFAKFGNEIIAANIVLFFGLHAIYLHGASSNSFRNLMAPYLLQWRQVLDAKKNGCRIYDFWGITIENKNLKWEGITRFKKGFGGKEISYAGVFDMPINNVLYKVYEMFKKR